MMIYPVASCDELRFLLQQAFPVKYTGRGVVCTAELPVSYQLQNNVIILFFLLLVWNFICKDHVSAVSRLHCWHMPKDHTNTSQSPPVLSLSQQRIHEPTLVLIHIFKSVLYTFSWWEWWLDQKVRHIVNKVDTVKQHQSVWAGRLNMGRQIEHGPADWTWANRSNTDRHHYLWGWQRWVEIVAWLSRCYQSWQIWLKAVFDTKEKHQQFTNDEGEIKKKSTKQKSVYKRFLSKT